METTQTLEQELKESFQKTAKPMLWVGMVSMVMSFAGLISAYVMTQKTGEWVSIPMPKSFTTSTILLIVSSITIHTALMFTKRGQHKLSLIGIVATLMLGIGFLVSQYNAFYELNAMGFYLSSKIMSAPSIMIISLLHVAHILAAIIVAIRMTIKSIRGKYTSTDYLGLELGVIFWHFLDLLWIGLFSFFYFTN